MTCHDHVDLVLVLEMSDNVRSSDVEEMSQFVSSLLQRMRVERDIARVGLVRYGSTVTHMRYLNTDLDDRDYYSRIEDAISGLRYEESFGDANTASALRAVLEEQLDRNRGYRSDVSAVVLLITSSRSGIYDYRTVEEAEALHAVNARVIVVGVGSRLTRDDIIALSSDSHGHDTSYIVSTYSDLSIILDDVTESMCVYQPPPPTPGPVGEYYQYFHI